MNWFGPYRHSQKEELIDKINESNNCESGGNPQSPDEPSPTIGPLKIGFGTNDAKSKEDIEKIDSVIEIISKHINKEF